MKVIHRITASILILVMAFANSSIAVLAESTLNLPSSLRIIEEEAFYGATSIDKIILSEGITEIREKAFADSTLSEINLPDSLLYIADDAFDSNVKFSTVEGSYAYSWAKKKTILENRVDFQGHSYLLFDAIALNIPSWDEAQNFCLSLGGHLAVVSSSDENRFLQNYIKNEERDDRVFIGYSDAKQESVWKWVSASDSNTNFTNWGYGEPNNSPSENYATISQRDGLWNDSKFIGKEYNSAVTWKTKFICEWDENNNVCAFDQEILKDSRMFNEYLRYCSVCCAWAAYYPLGDESIYTYLWSLGFKNVTRYNYDQDRRMSDHLVAYYLGHKDILDNGVPRTVYCAIVRGSTGANEWYSDFDIGTYKYAEGFAEAALELERRFYDYRAQYPPVDGGAPILWTTGHSRGAAVANFFAGRMIKAGNIFSEQNVHAYCYACPNVALKSEVIGSSAIKNYNLREDAVARIPLERWGYGRNGVSYPVESNISQAGNQYLNEFIESMINIFPTKEIFIEFRDLLLNNDTANNVFRAFFDGESFGLEEIKQAIRDVGPYLADFIVQKGLETAVESLVGQLKEIRDIGLDVMGAAADSLGLSTDAIDICFKVADNLEELQGDIEEVTEEITIMQRIANVEVMTYFFAQYAPFAMSHMQANYVEWVRCSTSNEIIDQVDTDLHQWLYLE